MMCFCIFLPVSPLERSAYIIAGIILLIGMDFIVSIHVLLFVSVCYGLTSCSGIFQLYGGGT